MGAATPRDSQSRTFPPIDSAIDIYKSTMSRALTSRGGGSVQLLTGHPPLRDTLPHVSAARGTESNILSDAVTDSPFSGEVCVM